MQFSTRVETFEQDHGGYQDGPCVLVVVNIMDLDTGEVSVMTGMVETWPDVQPWEGGSYAPTFASFTNSGDLYSTYTTQHQAIVELTAVLTTDAISTLVARQASPDRREGR